MAIVLVVLVHSTNQVAPNADTAVTDAIRAILSWGRFGVELFFILSGYLIGYLYLGAHSSPSRFIFSRFARIWPLWAVLTLFWFLVATLDFGGWQSELEPEDALRATILSLTFLNFLDSSTLDIFMPGVWSILIEVYCYLVFAFVMHRKLISIVSVFILINLVSIAASVSVSVGLDFWVISAWHELSLSSGSNFFLAGLLLSRVVSPASTFPFFVPNFGSEKHPGRQSERLMGLLLVAWIASWVVSPAVFGSQLEALGFVSAAFFASMFLGQIAQKLLAWLGRISYSLFFVHFVVIFGLRGASEPSLLVASSFGGWLLGMLSFFGITMALSIPFSVLSERFLERPAQRAILKRLVRPDSN